MVVLAIGMRNGAAIIVLSMYLSSCGKSPTLSELGEEQALPMASESREKMPERDFDAQSSLKLPVKVIFCKQVFGDLKVDPFKADGEVKAPDFTERWRSASQGLVLEQRLADSVRGAFLKASRTPLAAVPGVGYRDAAVFLDAKDKPMFAIIRLNMEGHFRLSSLVERIDDQYGIDTMVPQNRVFVRDEDENLSRIWNK